MLGCAQAEARALGFTRMIVSTHGYRKQPTGFIGRADFGKSGRKLPRK
jgi:hypothetical protein